MKKALLILFTTFCLSNIFAQSNLFLDNSYTVEEMVMDFFDTPNITISNVTHTDQMNAVAFFDAASTDLGLDAGIVICTGDIQNIPEPNMGNISGVFDTIIGDIDLQQMTSLPVTDAFAIEFDFTVSTSDTLHFNYVFGSEEYPEWVGSPFNDVFGFFLSGPGINGVFSNNATNIAMIPNSSDPVAINNVNHQTNSQFYVDNANGIHLQYDGFTTPLPASFVPIVGETYHVKIIVSDISDQQLDSGIFLSFNSLGQLGPLVPPTEFDFSVDASSNTVEFVNQSKYARSWSWDFGNSMTSTERNPAPVTYTTPGTYTVTLTTENYCCTETYSTDISVGVVGFFGANTIITPVSCNGGSDGSIQLEITGGTPPYDVPNLENLSAGTYSITITDANGLSFSLTVVVPEPEAISLIISSTPSNGTNADGTTIVEASGGTAPFTYEWSNGSTGDIVNGLLAGEYTVTVTDANNCTMIASVMVESITSVNDLKDFEMQIYPNPVTDQFRVEWLDGANIEKIEIFDMLGRAIPFTQEYISSGATIYFEEATLLGTYFLKVELENGKQSFERFVIVK